MSIYGSGHAAGYSAYGYGNFNTNLSGTSISYKCKKLINVFFNKQAHIRKSVRRTYNSIARVIGGDMDFKDILRHTKVNPCGTVKAPKPLQTMYLW
jgi:hypothetical protein